MGQYSDADTDTGSDMGMEEVQLIMAHAKEA